MKIILWIDDLRDPPMRADTKYMIARSVNQAKALLELAEKDAWEDKIDYISIDHDAGVYEPQGGDYINLLNWLEYRQHTQNGRIYPIEIHSMNAVGCVNMRAIIERNDWKEIR
jgi:hypothetical protein